MDTEISCACGCGETLNSTDSRGRPHRFISGHNSWKYKHAKERPCSQCGEVKPIADFHRLQGGHQPRCKACTADYFRSYYENNQAHIRQQAIAWNAANAERKRKYNRERGVLKADEIRARARIWRQQNPEKRRAADARYEARKRQNGGSFTATEWAALCAHYGSVCLCCGATKQLQPDHVIPLALGGSNGIENIQPLCGPCNFRKHLATTDYRPTAQVAIAPESGDDAP